MQNPYKGGTDGEDTDNEDSHDASWPLRPQDYPSLRFPLPDLRTDGNWL